MEAFDKAYQRRAATRDPELRIAIYYGLFIGPYLGNQLDRANEVTNRLVAEMAGEPDPVPRLISRRMRAATLIAMGRSPEALEDLEASYELYESAEISDFSARFAQDPGVQIWSYMLLAMWMCGDCDRAFEITDRNLATARRLRHGNTLCYAGLHDVALSIWAGKVDRAREVNDEMRQVATEQDMSLWKLYVTIHDAIIACMADEPGAPALLESALEEYRASGCWLWVTLYLAEQAKALLRAGDPAGAEAALRRALAEAEVTGEHWAAAELRRVEGDILAAGGDRDGARRCYETAIDVARSQQARPLEERAARSLDLLQPS
jgi:tetratricopeptide (TPR) repeat protein